MNIENGLLLPRDMTVAQAKNERAVIANDVVAGAAGVAAL